jgi:hypothetical protein
MLLEQQTQWCLIEVSDLKLRIFQMKRSGIPITRHGVQSLNSCSVVVLVGIMLRLKIFASRSVIGTV